MRLYLTELFYLLGPKKWWLLYMLAAFCLVSLLELTGIGIIAPYIRLATDPDIVENSEMLTGLATLLGIVDSKDLILLIGIGIVLLFSLKSLIYWYVQRAIIQFSQKCRQDLGVRLFKGYIHAPYVFHLKRNSAQAVQAVTQDSTAYASTIIRPVLQVLINAIIVMGLSILICVINFTATVGIVGIMLPLFFLFRSFQGKMYQWGKTVRETNIEVMQVVTQGMVSIKETKVIGCADYFVDYLEQAVKTSSLAITDIESFKIAPRIIVEALLVLFAIGSMSIYLATGEGSQEAFPLLGVLGLASVRLIPAITLLLNSATSLQNSRYQLDRIYQDLKESEALEQVPDLISATPLQSGSVLSFTDSVTLQDIHFSYPESDQKAINGVSILLKKGESIALIGKSGAGKTTIADLILGLLRPQVGDIQVDGTSIYTHLRAWQNLIGYIPQAIALNDDTIERNIAFGVPMDQINADQLGKAIRDAQLESLISQLPEGVKTRVGDRGIRLSGGQRQRIGIARALYHERDILVLDEATSALDNETEALVTEAIRSLGRTKSLIIIAHRLTTVRHCHRIYLIDQGRVLRSGSYDEVVGSSLDLEQTEEVVPGCQYEGA